MIDWLDPDPTMEGKKAQIWPLKKPGPNATPTQNQNRILHKKIRPNLWYIKIKVKKKTQIQTKYHEIAPAKNHNLILHKKNHTNPIVD